MRHALACGLALAAALPAAAQTAAAQTAMTQTADRYGYAPAEAQVPMLRSAASHPDLRPAAPPVAPPAPAPAPPLRLLSWPGKGVAATAATGPVPAATAPGPTLRRAVAAPAGAVSAAAAWTAPRPWDGRAASTATPAAAAPSTAAGVGPAPQSTFLAPPGLIAQAPDRPPTAVVASASPQGAAVMGPPRNPWYERWPDAAADPTTAAAGVGSAPVAAPPAAPATAPPPGASAAAPRPAAARALPVGTAKYYSVHTPYGHAPDPAPIPPQFFGPTADLSAPETPDPPRATLTANPTSAKAAVNAARLQQTQTD